MNKVGCNKNIVYYQILKNIAVINAWQIKPTIFKKDKVCKQSQCLQNTNIFFLHSHYYGYDPAGVNCCVCAEINESENQQNAMHYDVRDI